MQMHPYLTFNGQCEAAFTLYEQCLGGQLGAIFRYAGTSLADQVPADWQDKVMHGSITIGGQVVMGADVERNERAIAQQRQKPQLDFASEQRFEISCINSLLRKAGKQLLLRAVQAAKIDVKSCH